MPVGPEPRLHPLHRPRETDAGGLLLHHPLSLPRLRPVVGETQEVEAVWAFVVAGSLSEPRALEI
jgi:hypothetical protein